MVNRIKIPEVVVTGKPLGRHLAHDPLNARFPAETAAKIVSVTHESAGLPLDQGDVGSCTANALVGALNTYPHWKPGQNTLGEIEARALYHDETVLENEPWPPNDPGGSGLEVCKAGKNAGLLSSYQHASTLYSALRALVIRPVITGINWYDSFDEPDPEGYVEIALGAQVRGGHEIMANQIDAENRLVWFWNSWGTGWGVGGRFSMSFDTWEELLAEAGDVTVPRTALGWKAS